MSDRLRADIEAQGTDLARSLTDHRADASAIPASGAVVLAGSGDSYIAARAVEPLYRQVLGPRARAASSLDAVVAGGGPGAVVVAVSVSGTVARTLEAAQVAKADGGLVVAVTADPASPLAEAADVTVAMPAPLDRELAHARDYTMTLLALAAVLERLSGERLDELDRWVDGVGAASETCLVAAADLPVLATTPRMTWFLGAEPDVATAMYGAMKLWEAGGQAAAWDGLEEFAHGSMVMARPGDRAVLVATGVAGDHAARMVDGLVELRLDPLVLSDRPPPPGVDGLAVPSTPSPWSPFWSCLAVQAAVHRSATATGVDVSDPWAGHPDAEVADRVHRTWTKGTAPARSASPREDNHG